MYLEKIIKKLFVENQLFLLSFVLGLHPLLVHATRNLVIKDHGVMGYVFPIKERSLLEVIQEKLKTAQANGTIKNLQIKFQEKVTKKISRPQAVTGINHTTVDSERSFDPTYVQPTNITDHKGRVIISKGTQVNPLDHVSWGEPLLFIDGDELSHVTWALNQPAGKIILVKGAPLDLEQQYKRAFYFDQAGLLTRKFSITQVPARVSQAGTVLKIEEIKL